MRDLFNRIDVKQSVDAVIRTADVNGTGVDLQFYNGAIVLYHFGITGDTLSGTVKVACVLEDSDDDSTYAAVAAANRLGSLQTVDDNTEDQATYVVGYIGAKRYIRAVFDFTGTHTNGIEVGADVVRWRKRHLGGVPV